jgi:hypothetical protein
MLRRLIKYCAIVCLTSATAFAGGEQPSKPHQTGKAISRPKQAHRSCYVLLSGSLIPQPCERLLGPEPSTAIPMDIIGGYPPRVAPPGELSRGNTKPSSTGKRRAQSSTEASSLSR